MNKKIIASLLVLTCIAMMPITSIADFPTGDLGYSDDIIAGAEFEWSVSKFDVSGDFAAYTDEFYIGDISLTEGATIKLVVTEDPDEAVGDWYEAYVNDVIVTNPDDIFIGYGMGYMYGFSGGFINPVTYTNATGTYDLYEQIFEELQELNDEYTYDYSTSLYGITMEVHATESIEFAMKGDVLAITLIMKMELMMDSGVTSMSNKIDMLSVTTINTVTGLLGKSELKLDVETDYMNGAMHLVLDSGYAATPYNWAYSFLGLSVIAAVVALAKRKRR